MSMGGYVYVSTGILKGQRHQSPWLEFQEASCEPTDLGAWNQTQVSCKSIRSFSFRSLPWGPPEWCSPYSECWGEHLMSIVEFNFSKLDFNPLLLSHTWHLVYTRVVRARTQFMLPVHSLLHQHWALTKQDCPLGQTASKGLALSIHNILGSISQTNKNLNEKKNPPQDLMTINNHYSDLKALCMIHSASLATPSSTPMHFSGHSLVQWPEDTFACNPWNSLLLVMQKVELGMELKVCSPRLHNTLSLILVP